MTLLLVNFGEFRKVLIGHPFLRTKKNLKTKLGTRNSIVTYKFVRREFRKYFHDVYIRYEGLKESVTQKTDILREMFGTKSNQSFHIKTGGKFG